MLHSINYNEQTGAETYDWFDAKIVNGVLDIPRAGLMAEAGKAGFEPCCLQPWRSMRHSTELRLLGMTKEAWLHAARQ